MASVTSRALDEGAVLYESPTRGYRTKILVSMTVVLVLALTLMVIIIIGFVILLFAGDAWRRELALPPFALLLLLDIVLLVLIPFMWWVLYHQVFVVTTEGLTVTPAIRRPRHVPWSEVDRLETEHGGFLRGALVVVTTTGERITASVTNTSNAKSFAPLPAHLARNTRGAPAPHVAAHAALDLYRSGAFHR